MAEFFRSLQADRGFPGGTLANSGSCSTRIRPFSGGSIRLTVIGPGERQLGSTQMNHPIFRVCPGLTTLSTVGTGLCRANAPIG
ncbi:hypothetical protein [Methylobacterium indicum]|uniref:hypothetical protein n=1 Tax=Methylobacterium indicum TaxID=1775910 RepID=UPI000AD35201|nr:hypothetical protein [Methylobacterium indicum]